MHEISLCESLIQMIADRRQVDGFSRVRRVSLEIGPFSCLDPDALTYAFDILQRGTFLEGAVLDIARPPGQAVCADCGAEVKVRDRLALCPQCGGQHLKAQDGQSMRLVEMEVW